MSKRAKPEEIIAKLRAVEVRNSRNAVQQADETPMCGSKRDRNSPAHMRRSTSATTASAVMPKCSYSAL